MKTTFNFKSMWVAALLAIAACGDDDGGSLDDAQPVMDNYAVVVHAAYAEALSKAEALKTAVDAFVAAAEKALGAYDTKVKALSADIGADKPTISMVRYMPGKIRLYAKASFIGTILDDARLPRPANQQINDLAVEVSPEKIDQADADAIFHSTQVRAGECRTFLHTLGGASAAVLNSRS